MAFPRLTLKDAPRPAAGLSSRGDIAMFVGLVARTGAPVPQPVLDDLAKAGWLGTLPFSRPAAAIAALLDVPVAVDSWSAFATLFAWDQRVVEPGSPDRIPCALGLAVKSFFTEGGVRAWIVRTGDPLPLRPGGDPAASIKARRLLLDWREGAKPADAASRAMLVPGGLGLADAPGEATQPATWHGVEHVWGIDEVALLLLPDLAELLGPAATIVADPPHPPAPPENWKACAPALPGFAAPQRAARPAIAAPRLDMAGYRAWAGVVRYVLGRLAVPRGSAHRRDIMLVASLPLPSTDPAMPLHAEAWPLATLTAPGGMAAKTAFFDEAGIASARLQLAYPWIETAASRACPEGVEAPEGVVAGVLARTSLALGAFRDAGGQASPSVRRCLPELATSDLMRGVPGSADWLGERLTLIGDPSGLGHRLLSDATTSQSVAWRPGGVSRTVDIVLRASRALGQEQMFLGNGPALWAAIRNDLETYLERLRVAGALDGSPAEAYGVRCGADTMRQVDIDQGRLIVEIDLNPAQPVGWITVTLALGLDAQPVAEAA